LADRLPNWPREQSRSEPIRRADPTAVPFRKPFPHAIIYLDRPDEIYVVAVMPLRKEPGYWKHRLTD
jgi:hypothetical protein